MSSNQGLDNYTRVVNTYRQWEIVTITFSSEIRWPENSIRSQHTSYVPSHIHLTQDILVLRMRERVRTFDDGTTLHALFM